MGNNRFQWYEEIKESDELTQGDILINFPILKVEDYNKFVEHYLKGTLEGQKFQPVADFADYIILTQACDFVNKKGEMGNVILCRIHDAKQLKFGKNKLEGIVKGTNNQFYMLNEDLEFKADYLEDGFDFHIVDFNDIEKVPEQVVRDYAKSVKKRLRLLPPYREHLSQAFAKYFMRIGLPSDIDREKIKRL